MDEWIRPQDKKIYDELWKEGKHRPIKNKKRKTTRSNLVKMKCAYCKKIKYERASRLKYYKNHFCNKFHHDLYRRNNV